jgi:hypothetical protein
MMSLFTQETKISFATGEVEKPGQMPLNGMVMMLTNKLNIKTGTLAAKLLVLSSLMRTLNSSEFSMLDIWSQ